MREIQSTSVCVPGKHCMNDCKYCCSKMHGADYEDNFSGISSFEEYIENMTKRLSFVREQGCNTCILTGNVEPQQNKEFLKVFGLVNKNLPNPFKNIEIQTSGTYIDEDMLNFLHSFCGVTTVAISVACLNNDAINRLIISSPDSLLSVKRLSKNVKELGMNLRICLNMSDNILDDSVPFAADSIFNLCKEYGADQVTFRKLWAPDNTTPQGKWIEENVTEKTDNLISELKATIKEKGLFLNKLEYGANRYNYLGFSVVIDEDSMAQGNDDDDEVTGKVNKDAVKYVVLREDGKLYDRWDIPDLVF